MHYMDNKSVLMSTKNITLVMLTLQQYMNLKPSSNLFTLPLSTSRSVILLNGKTKIALFHPQLKPFFNVITEIVNKKM